MKSFHERHLPYRTILCDVELGLKIWKNWIWIFFQCPVGPIFCNSERWIALNKVVTVFPSRAHRLYVCFTATMEAKASTCRRIWTWSNCGFRSCNSWKLHKVMDLSSRKTYLISYSCRKFKLQHVMLLRNPNFCGFGVLSCIVCTKSPPNY